MNAPKWLGHALCFTSLLILAGGAGCSSSTGSHFGDGDSGVGGGGDGTGDGGAGPGFPTGEGGTGDGDGGFAACATAEATATRTPVYMQIILDGSGSMDFSPANDPLDPGNQRGVKWLAVRGALYAFWDQLVATPDTSFGVGLYLFSSNSTKSATAVDVPIAVVDAAQANALKNRVKPPTAPSGGTPLKQAIAGQLPLLEDFTPAAPLLTGGKRVLVVMTDGVPDGGGSDQTACVNDAQAAFALTTKQVTTFAVGVGDPTAATSDYDEVFMGNLAVAGGAPAPGCTPGWNQSSPSSQIPCHFQITPGTKTAAQIQADFLAAINTIRDTVSSCEFTLDKSGGPIDPSKVNVVYTPSTGTPETIPQDPTNGWSYDNPTDPSTVTLNGTSCAELKADSSGTIKIVLGCTTRVP